MRDGAEASAVTCTRACSGSVNAVTPALSPWLWFPELAGSQLACLPLLGSCSRCSSASCVLTGGVVCLYRIISKLPVKITVLNRLHLLRFGFFFFFADVHHCHMSQVPPAQLIKCRSCLTRFGMTFLTLKGAFMVSFLNAKPLTVLFFSLSFRGRP